MNIKKFLESLTINEYNDLEDIIITRLKKQEEKEDDYVKWIEENKQNKQQKEDKIVNLLEQPEPWKGSHY